MISEKQGLSNKIQVITNLSGQPWKLFLITAAISVLIIVIVLVISLIVKLPVGYFTRDPLQILDAPLYLGILSNVGILFWCSSAVLCFFSFHLLRRSLNDHSIFLLLCGILTTVLLLDDFFILHEVVYRNYLHIPQKAVFISYLMAMIYIFFRFRKLIYETEFLFLFSALLMFSFSVVVDALPQHILPFHHIFEDGSKFIGIVFWFIYFLRTSLFALKILYLHNCEKV